MDPSDPENAYILTFIQFWAIPLGLGVPGILIFAGVILKAIGVVEIKVEQK
jgi:hypothetical protein